MSMIHLSKNIHNILIHYKLLLTKYCLAQYLSFKFSFKMMIYCVIKINDSLICYPIVFKHYNK